MNKEIYKPLGGDSFLDSFILKKLEEYIEPKRRGTPKGEIIGLKRQKYFGALLCLKDHSSIKELARILGIKPELLSKWRTEEPFKQTKLELAAEFVSLIPYHLKARVRQEGILAREYRELPLDKIIYEPVPILNWNEFLDIKYWTDILGEALVQVLIEQGAKENDSRTKQEYGALIGLLIRDHHALKKYKEDKAPVPKVIQKAKQMSTLKKSDYMDLLYILTREYMNDTDKKGFIYSLHRSCERFKPVDMEIDLNLPAG